MELTKGQRNTPVSESSKYPSSVEITYDLWHREEMTKDLWYWSAYMVDIRRHNFAGRVIHNEEDEDEDRKCRRRRNFDLWNEG
jgi:hypothetical protein